ncbi:peptide-methionine (S)-S-oxide reductase MsrA [Halopseudomonas salegens]|uniref:Peptide methionine sulfoxide reductase MsrA n=1 Tax=Halopseudomonas salegens TaxID=1434072 RepID=A0A1H2GZC6_9GAMM|nr:peptide-methionine (S)-S-oxide reductase MsrA [Halopseudomonas salegens]SDU24967.1 peptide-methionine (S)-S-oxide reductase [Halopseudomonas salegens]
MFFRRQPPEHKMRLPSADEALPGRDTPIATSTLHAVLNTRIQPPFPEGMQQIVFGMGCFWGAERRFWQQPGIFTTAVGYCGGLTPNPTYEEVCSGLTGHNEVVLVVFDPEQTSLESLFRVFWESHDPTQGMQQGNDAGTQYRSGIYVSNMHQRTLAEVSKANYANALQDAGLDPITTEILPADAFYYAEDYHQQYLHKNPNGYCGLGGTGVRLPG